MTKTNDCPLEAVEQAELVSWYDSTYSAMKGLLFMIPNGTHLAGSPKQRAIQAGRLKAQGQRNGVPDLFLPVAASGHHGLFIEMKRRKGGQVSPKQVKWCEYLNAAGYRAVICKGADEAKEAIKCYLSTIT